MPPLIGFRRVSFAYESSHPVLEEVNFELQPGERTALTGPNGSGKTTLLHLAVGLLRPDAGQMEAFGRIRRRESDFREVRTRLGLVFQDPDDQLFCPTVGEDVAFGPLNLGKSREEAAAVVRDTLDSLGLASYQDRITYKLSGGEKRLVSLATVLAMAPDVLLLDEPTSGLDKDIVDRIVEILDGLSLAMIVVSHDGDFLQRVANTAVRLQGGRLESCSLSKTVGDHAKS